MVCTCKEILISFNKKGNFDTCCKMGDPSQHYAKWNKPVTKRQILHDSTYMISRVVRVLETESTRMVCRAGRGEWRVV